VLEARPIPPIVVFEGFVGFDVFFLVFRGWLLLMTVVGRATTSNLPKWFIVGYSRSTTRWVANGWQSGEVVVVMSVVMSVAMAMAVGVEDVGFAVPAMALSIPTPPAATQRRARGCSRCG